MKVARVRNITSLFREDVRNLIFRGIEKVELSFDPVAMFADLTNAIGRPDLGLFVGSEAHRARAVAIALLPATQAMMAPQVLLAYNQGPPELARAVGRRLREWIIASGYDRFLCLNPHRADPVFIRGFRHMGPGRRVASLMEFDLREDTHEEAAPETGDDRPTESGGAGGAVYRLGRKAGDAAA